MVALPTDQNGKLHVFDLYSREASLCKAMGSERVIGIDIEIRPYNRRAIEAHELSSYITLIEGSSTDAAIVGKVRSLVIAGETVLVLLDSNAI